MKALSNTQRKGKDRPWVVERREGRGDRTVSSGSPPPTQARKAFN